MDVFQELEQASFRIPDGYVESVIEDIDSMFSGEVLISEPTFVNIKWYAKPMQKEAAAIWEECGFLRKETETNIESGLWEWASIHGKLEKKNDIFHVHWKSPTTKYSASWSAFYRWFLCTLGPPVY